VRTSFYTDGVLLAVSLESSRLRYIYHHDGAFYSQDGSTLMRGNLRPDIRFHCVGNYVVAICGSQALLFREGKNVGRLNVDRYRLKEAAISGNCSSLYFASGGRLWRQALPKGKDEKTLPTPQDLGDVLQGQTKVFAGYEFGFAFYRAGQFRRAFLFDLERGLRTPVDITPLSGDIIDVDCLFGNRSLWLLVSSLESGKLVNRCACIDDNGNVQAVAWAEDGDNSWLGSLRGKTVATYQVNGLPVDTLLASTADGVVQVQCLNNRLKQTKVYANTENLVSAGENILFSPEGLYVIDSHRIDLITTTPGG